MANLKTAIIGLGSQGGRWGKFFSSQPDVDLVAAVDINQTQLDIFQKKFKVPNSFKSMDELMAKKEELGLDFITIATPHYLHARQTIKAAENKLHVFCEKPMATTTIECDEMIKACKDNGVKLNIGFHQRYDKNRILAKKALESGIIGKVFHANVQALWFRKEPYFLNSTPVPENEDEDWEGWRGHWKTEGGSALINQTIHLLDGYLFMMGDELKNVMASANITMHEFIETEDNVAANVTFKSGALGLIQAGVSYKFNSDTFEFYGNKGTLKISKKGIHLDGVKDGKKILKGLKKSIGNTGGDFVMKDFLNAIKTDTLALIPGEEGRKTIELIRAIYHSVMGGKKIEIPFTDNAEHPELARLNFECPK